MPRQDRIFSQAQIRKVKQMNDEGYSSSEIARMLGMSRGQYDWYAMRKGTFGHLKRRQGFHNKNPRKTRHDDNEAEGRCWGVKNWQQRRDKIKAKWPEGEKMRRAHQQLPMNEKIYGLDPRFQQRKDKRTNPNG